MPHLVKVQEQYKAQGLKVLAPHRQDPNQAEVCGLCRKNKVNYSVFSGGSLVGEDGGGIPHAWLFDASGKCVADGHPDQVYKKLPEVLAAAPHWITRGKKLESKEGKTISEGLKAGQPWSWALEQADKATKAKDEKAKEEGAFLKEQVLAQSERDLAAAQAAEESDPLQAQQLYEQVHKSYGKKVDAGTKAEARLKELKKDKAFQKELEAAKLVSQMKELSQGLTIKDGKWDHEGNRAILEQLKGGAKTLSKKHGDAKIAQKYLEELKGYGITP